MRKRNIISAIITLLLTAISIDAYMQKIPSFIKGEILKEGDILIKKRIYKNMTNKG